MQKKPQPIMPYRKRVKVVAAISYVDKAVMQKEYSPLNNCKRYKPDILFESLTHSEFPANEFIRTRGGSIMYTGFFTGQSSTKIKDKVKKWKEQS